MPYKRGYVKKRRKKKGFNYYAGKTQSAIKVASTALATARAVKDLLNVEKKYHDVQATNQSLAYDAVSSTLLNAVAQGDTDQTRDGNSLKILNLSMYGNIRVTGTAAQQLQIVTGKQH